MISANNVTLRIGKKALFEDVNIKFTEGNCYGLIGANGAGKTTTLQTITGMLQAKKGHILFEGQDITKVPGHKIVTMGMAHVPEGRRVFANLSVYENLKLGAYTRKDKNEISQSLEMVYERLNTEYGAILMDPPYHAHAFDGALAVIYNAGTKENAGIFSQSQGWIILAEALKGHGDRAFKYFIENAPAAQNDRAEIRRLEPYCYGQFTEGKASPNFGRSHVHWLTGTASTVMVGCVEGILGMRPDFRGLHIEPPSIPKAWDGFEIEKDFRGCHLHIVVKNPDHVESGCKSLLVNGQAVEGDYIPKELLSEQTEIELTM